MMLEIGKLYKIKPGKHICYIADIRISDIHFLMSDDIFVLLSERVLTDPVGTYTHLNILLKDTVYIIPDIMGDLMTIFEEVKSS